MSKCRHCDADVIPIPIPNEVAGTAVVKGGLGAATTGLAGFFAVTTGKGAFIAAILGGPATVGVAALIGGGVVLAKALGDGKSPVDLMCPKCKSDW